MYKEIEIVISWAVLGPRMGKAKLNIVSLHLEVLINLQISIKILFQNWLVFFT